MQRDRPDLDQVQQRWQITADEPRRTLPGLGPDALDAHGTRVLRRVLLKERVPADSFRIALQPQRPIREDRQQYWGNLGVVAHQRALRDAVAREVDLVEARYAKRATVVELELAVASRALDVGELLNDGS